MGFNIITNISNDIQFLLLLCQMIIWLIVFRICFFKTHIAITAVLNIKIVDYFFCFVDYSFLLAFLEPRRVFLTMEVYVLFALPV